ncbi:MAG: V-type ATPase subunit [Candidatus Heimdallarchaeota archaeon]|nr:V-type ATPase subunit [Candidatus Heimdallarchaeota archaeon]
MGSTTPFLMAKAHANHARSPSWQQISAMLNSSKIVDVEGILANTSYGDVMNIVRPSVDLPEFEKEMRNSFAKLLHLYQRSAPPPIAKLLDAYSIIIDAENINLIMQAILRNNISDDLEKIITPVGKLGMSHYQRMMKSATVDIASDFIPYPFVRKEVQKALNLSDDPDEKVFYLSSALSHSSFATLNALAPKWIRAEIELLNLETICRAINLEIDAKIWMIPNRGVVNKKAQTLQSMKTPREAINYILPQFPIQGPLKMALTANDQDIVAVLEDAALSYLHAQHKHRFYLVNREETILDFFAIKMAEIEDISRILFSKLKGIPAEEIRGMLYPIYKR